MKEPVSKFGWKQKAAKCFQENCQKTSDATAMRYRTTRNLNALTQVNRGLKLRKKSPQDNRKIRITLARINCEILQKIRPNIIVMVDWA